MTRTSPARLHEVLAVGIESLGIALPPGASEKLVELVQLLERWNRKFNLTSVRDPEEMIEKHILDSLPVVGQIEAAPSLLDLGTGAGFPGLPVAIAAPQTAVTLVDANAKRIAFIKQAAATLRIPLRAVHFHLAGDPVREGLTRADCVVSRAFLGPADFLPLARHYVRPGGSVLCMLGSLGLPAEAACDGLIFETLTSYRLPLSDAQRAIARFRANLLP